MYKKITICFAKKQNNQKKDILKIFFFLIIFMFIFFLPPSLKAIHQQNNKNGNYQISDCQQENESLCNKIKYKNTSKKLYAWNSATVKKIDEEPNWWALLKNKIIVKID